MTKYENYLNQKNQVEKLGNQLMTDSDLSILEKKLIFEDIGKIQTDIYHFNDEVLESIFDSILDGEYTEKHETVYVIYEIENYVMSLKQAVRGTLGKYSRDVSDVRDIKDDGFRIYPISDEVFRRYEHILLNKAFKEGVAEFDFNW